MTTQTETEIKDSLSQTTVGKEWSAPTITPLNVPHTDGKGPGASEATIPSGPS